MDRSVRVGPNASPKWLCRWLGCIPRPCFAIVRVRIRSGPALVQTWSERQPVQVCRRCAQLSTSVTVPVLPGDEVDSVLVELDA